MVRAPAMKGAMELLTHYQAKERGACNITANNTAQGRAGLPDDIGAAIALLLTQGSQWINGQRVEASDGMFLSGKKRDRSLRQLLPRLRSLLYSTQARCMTIRSRTTSYTQ
jgi:hypothetical protein